MTRTFRASLSRNSCVSPGTATASAESLVELLDEQLDQVAGGSASVHGPGQSQNSTHSDDKGRAHNAIFHCPCTT
jgi:hypothetical protein